MEISWDAALFSGVRLSPRRLAEEVAAALGQLTRPLVEVVRLHLEALDTAIALDAPELLADQLRWQQVRLETIGAALGVEQVQQACRDALAPHLDEAGRARLVSVHDDASVLAASGRLTDHAVELAEGPARRYLEAALGGRRDEAIAIVRDLMLEGVDVSVIMLEVLQPAQIELGRLWETGEISVAHEHYTTAITQLALSLLYPRLLLDRTLVGRSMVGVSVGAEAHEVGIRMISDLLEQAGWHTAYLGASVPADDVVDAVARQRADVLAISATMAGHLREVKVLIERLRADPRCAGVKVLVGGRPFSINSRLATQVGADGWAPGAREALALCQAWTSDRAGGERVGAS